MGKYTTRDPMYKESKIKGGNHKGPVQLFPVKKAKKQGNKSVNA
tara:strand:+ start:822 stop:953 length:132 start_codon:yes stop_codon:yes gene_type:complete